METGVLVAIIAAAASIIGGIVSGAFSLLLNHAKHKDERADRKEDARTDWEKHVDECLDADKHAIRELQRRMDESDETKRLILEGVTLLVRHILDSNHTDALKEWSDKVNKVLIEKI